MLPLQMVVCLPPYFNRIVVVYLAQIIENRVVKYYWIRAIVSEIRARSVGQAVPGRFILRIANITLLLYLIVW